jgi:hypothetical protein
MKDMKQKRILVPTRSLDDWKSLLAEPEKHWKPGHSAMLTALAVEGKAREDFGPTLAQWQAQVSGKGYRIRLRHILENIGLKDTIPDHIRYQLLHRTASAVLEAKRFHCMAAVMIVQSFIESDLENHFGDYVHFIQLYGKTPAKDNLVFLAKLNEILLYSAWVYTEPPADNLIPLAS